MLDELMGICPNTIVFALFSEREMKSLNGKIVLPNLDFTALTSKQQFNDGYTRVKYQEYSRSSQVSEPDITTITEGLGAKIDRSKRKGRKRTESVGITKNVTNGIGTTETNSSEKGTSENSDESSGTSIGSTTNYGEPNRYSDDYRTNNGKREGRGSSSSKGHSTSNQRKRDVSRGSNISVTDGEDEGEGLAMGLSVQNTIAHQRGIVRSRTESVANRRVYLAKFRIEESPTGKLLRATNDQISQMWHQWRMLGPREILVSVGNKRTVWGVVPTVHDAIPNYTQAIFEKIRERYLVHTCNTNGSNGHKMAARKHGKRGME